MTIASRIERISGRLSDQGSNLFHGASLMALTSVIYAGRTGIAGDVFVSFAHSFGTNLAVIASAMVFLAALWGFMLMVYFVIAMIVVTVQRIRGVRPPSVEPASMTQREVNISTFVLWAERLDAYEVGQIGDASIISISTDMEPIASVETAPRRSTLTINGNVISIEMDLTIHYADHSSFTVDALLTGTVFGYSPDITRLTRITHTAA